MAHSRAAIPVLAVVLVGGLSAPALGAERFDGACDMSGTVRHDPPLTEEPARTAIRGHFRGTCSGTLTGEDGRARVLDGVRADYRVRDAGGALSCFGGEAAGAGSLRFAGGDEIDFTLVERRPAPGVALVTLTGAAGGTGTVAGTVDLGEDLMELEERCRGAGVRTIRGDARIVGAGLSG